MLKIRRPLGRLIFNMGIAIPGKTVFLIETAPWQWQRQSVVRTAITITRGRKENISRRDYELLIKILLAFFKTLILILIIRLSHDFAHATVPYPPYHAQSKEDLIWLLNLPYSSFSRFKWWSHKPFMKWLPAFLNSRCICSCWTQDLQREGYCIMSYMMTSANGKFSVLLVICAWNSPVTGEFPAQRPETRSFGVFFELCLNKRLTK